ncbi:MAG: hypothetical protein QM630_04450 [Microbacterium sp.]
MSSEIDIDYGGAIAVDPEVLRDVAARLAGVSADFGDALDGIRKARRIVLGSTTLSEHVDVHALWASVDRVEALRDDCDSAVAGTRLMADAFEYTELKAEADALALSDRAAADALYLRMDRLASGDPRVVALSAMLVLDWQNSRFAGLDSQFGLGVMNPLFGLVGFLGANAGRGKIWPGMRLTGVPDAVRVEPVKTSSPAAAPAGIPDAFRRMPQTPGAQVAVEKYTMPNGTTKFVAYVKGTQSVGGADPWDMKSNVELYTGKKSASYQATLDALEAAGAQPGDEVDIVAHSQAGMVAAHLSMEGPYDVHVQITAGSPVEPTVGDDQIVVQFRHTDDVVSSLAGGGSPGPGGGPGSFTVTREGDPFDGPQDLLLDTHMLDSYIETAELAEKSGDPRVESLDEFWEGLNEAVEIERTEYRAERVEE